MRKRGRFVFGNIQDVIQVDHPQHHLHSRVGGKERTSPSSALQGGEGADQYADTRTIEIADAGKIDREIEGFTGKSFVGFFRVVGAFSDDFPALMGDFPALVNIDGLLVFIEPPHACRNCNSQRQSSMSLFCQSARK
jgi:hypothetical protein